MILYFTKKYLTVSLISAGFLAIIMSLAGMQNVILKSFIWSGLVSGYVTWYFFNKKNLWVLYYNVKISKYIMIGMNILLFEIMAVTVILLTQSRIH